MANHPKLSKDAFGWIQDTSAEESETEAHADQPAQPVKKTPVPPKRKGPRRVFVRFKANGDIAAMTELLSGRDKTQAPPFLYVPPDHKVEELRVPDEFAAATLVEIHHQCRVDTTGEKPKLVKIIKDV